MAEFPHPLEEAKNDLRRDRREAVSRRPVRLRPSTLPYRQRLQEGTLLSQTLDWNQVFLVHNRPLWQRLVSVRFPDLEALRRSPWHDTTELDRLIATGRQAVTAFLETATPNALLRGLSAFEYIEKIRVGFSLRFFSSQNETDRHTMADFRPARRSSEYDISIRLQDFRSRDKVWPNAKDSSGRLLPCNIAYTYQRSASHMAVTLFHELLHVWFVNRFANTNLGDLQTGHFDVFKCQIHPEFLGRLRRFFAEMDRRERSLE